MKISLGGLERDGFVKLVADGTITAIDFGVDGKNPLENILGPSWATFKIILDFAQVSYIDSSAVGWLIGTQKASQTAGGAIAVFKIQPTVKQVFDLLKVGRVVPICETEQAARAAIGGQQ